MKRLENKALVVTGGAGSVSKASAQKMIKEGAKVLITDLDQEALKIVSEEINSVD
jgi:NADP-dependent 3-hydroxy acid dehydrogenase YdfG